MDYGDRDFLPLRISGLEIAENLCRESIATLGERSFLGGFGFAGEASTVKELRRA